MFISWLKFRAKQDVSGHLVLPNFHRDEVIRNLRANGVDEFLISCTLSEIDAAIKAAYDEGGYHP